jgi:ribonuclease BN (tRNA processing enzyme)
MVVIKAKPLGGLIAGCLFSLVGTISYAACSANGVQLQILGSGGPGDSMGRASSAYLLWINGESKVLVDAGSGSKNHFYQSGARMEQIDLVALSHLHPDHSVELPAILWPGGGSFDLAGPKGSDVFPSISRFTDLVFGENGVYEIFQGRVDINVIELDISEVSQVWQQDEITVTGMGVPHGDVPTLGYRLEVGDTSIGFTSDQTGSNPAFVDFIRGVDSLVIHMAANENATGIIADLHATPSVWGQMAETASVGQVVVSHISTSDSNQLQENLQILADNYSGEVLVAEDLMCVDLP